MEPSIAPKSCRKFLHSLHTCKDCRSKSGRRHRSRHGSGVPLSSGVQNGEFLPWGGDCCWDQRPRSLSFQEKHTQEASRQSRLDSATPTVGCRYVPPFFAQNDGCLWQTEAVTESTWYYYLYDQLVICFCFCSSLAILLVSLQVICFVSRELCSEARRAPDHASCIHAGILREEDFFELESRFALHRNSDLSDSCLCRQFVNVMRGKDQSLCLLKAWKYYRGLSIASNLNLDSL